MSKKIRIDVEDVIEFHKRRAYWDSVPIQDVEFFENGAKIEVDPEIINEWRFIGLSNDYFVLHHLKGKE